MSDDEAIARAFIAQYRTLRDDVYKAWYLPWTEARGQFAAAEERVKSIRSSPLALFAQLQPVVSTAMGAEVRTDRRVAALRVVEALRMQAAADGGKLPESLSQVTVVPIPDDPATGKPFAYRLGDGAAILEAGPEGIKGKAPNYRLTIRRSTP
jgi:hypothetical protein